MQLNDLFEKIPAVISNFISVIFCINKDNDECYKVEYTGRELKIIEKNNYAYFKEYLGEYPSIVSEIENNETTKMVIDSSLFVYMETEEDYKIVIISNLTDSVDMKEKEYSLLIADDSDVITKFFTKTFENKFNILVAKDGNEALSLINENLDTNLIGAFIDLQMPNKNGFEVLEELKANNLFETIPVSVISGEDTQDGIEKATSYPIVDMLQKPFGVAAAESIVSKTIAFSPKYKKEK